MAYKPTTEPFCDMAAHISLCFVVLAKMLNCLFSQTYSQLAHPIQQAKAMGLQFHSKILDIDNIDVSYSWHSKLFQGLFKSW